MICELCGCEVGTGWCSVCTEEANACYDEQQRFCGGQSMKFNIDPDDLHDVRTATDIRDKFHKEIARRAASGETVRVTSGGETLFMVGPDGIIRDSGILETY